MSSFFFDKEKKVLNWLNRFPPEMHEFIKELVVYNALMHPDKATLLRLPFFEEEVGAAIINEAPKPEVPTPKEPAPPPSFVPPPPPPSSVSKEEDKTNIDSWLNM